MSTFRVGLAGLGTVGIGVIKILETHAKTLTLRAGRPIEVVAVSARNRTKSRGVDLSPYDWEDDAVTLANREDVDCVVEVIGGSDGPAKTCVEAGLTQGKHVVTANKALMAHHGHALALLAENKGINLKFEAAVAGGIPAIKVIRDSLTGNAIHTVQGVLNGTCNYILTQMQDEGGDYTEVLQDAQKLGYAELDPSFDVGGIDAAHKLALLSAIAFGTQVNFNGIYTRGIEDISLTDIAFAQELGYAIKLLAFAHTSENGVEQRVEPCLIPSDSLLGALSGVTNAVVFDGDFCNQISMTGPGAGEGPTASAVVADIVDLAKGERAPVFGQPATQLAPASERPALSQPAEYYVRLQVNDKAGVLAQVADAFAQHGVSLKNMHQPTEEDGQAFILIVTHKVQDTDITQAIERIAALPDCLAQPVTLRIQE